MIQRCNKVILAMFSLMIILWQPQSPALENRVAIASAHPLATYAGFEIIDKGGNVFDAAVAVSAALAVVEPAGSGLGGGGFWLLHRAEDGYETMLDGREKAPLAATRDMYLDKNGNLMKDLSINGALSAGIPGLPAALVHLSEKYGKLSLAETLEPAINYARNGFKIGARHQKLLAFRKAVLLKSHEAAKIFLNNGAIPKKGSILQQPELAATLEKLADSGRAGFYQGDVAEAMVSAVRSAGGIWTKVDLEQYSVIEREPIQGEYQGIKITSAAPPSAGGIVLVEALNILSGYDLSAVDSVTRKHLIAEAMRRAYHDRARYLGDPDYVEIPAKRLLSADYAAGLRAGIRADKAMPSEYLAGETLTKQEGRNTTHFSIIDQQDNRVAATLSINFPFGSGFIAPGTGVLLNDEMDDFVSLPGVGNGYGLTGGTANSIAPGKRMLSSMTPTFLEQGQRVAVLGTPGGSRIISMVLLAALDFVDQGKPDSWVATARFHHQYSPDRVQYEKAGLTTEEQQKLTDLGHQLNEVSYQYGNMQAVQLHKQKRQLSAASDPRGEGFAIVR